MKDKLVFFLWRRRTAFFSFGPLFILLVAKPSISTWLIAIPLVLLGQAIRFWAAGHLRKNNCVVTSGPYGYVRNPLYVGSLCVFLGFCTMADRWGIMLVFLLLFLILHTGATIHEERHLSRVFGEDFSEYCKRVPRLIPRLTSIGGQGRFSFQLVLTNREPVSAVGTLVVVLLFLVRATLVRYDVIEAIVKAVR